jgi:lipopolysaccharide transport system ATP-binding protein
MQFAICVENLSKCYRINHAGDVRYQYRTMRDSLADAIQAPFKRWSSSGAVRRNEEFWALKDVSFQVEPGEVVGIIGRNGAGKSTLLKILSRITKPTRGHVALHGRVGSLLEVGTGFHPELTGRENVYLNGSILGITRRDIDRHFDAIVAFAEVEQFLDTPVKRYSSGMYVRLAFAVAAHLEPEILVIDEVLAVGDVAFQKKCLGRMSEVARDGRTVLFVSHNMAAIQQLTSKSILLSDGKIAFQGKTEQAVQRYLNDASDAAACVYDVTAQPRKFPELSRAVEFVSLQFDECATNIFGADAPIPIRISARASATIESFRFSMTIHRLDGSPVGNFFGPPTLQLRKGEEAAFKLVLSDLRLAPGKYYCNAATGVGNNMTEEKDFDIVCDVLCFEVMPEEGDQGTRARWTPGWGSIRFLPPRVERVA